MADYRDHEAEERYEASLRAEEQETGFRKERSSYTHVVCVACGNVVGDRKIHREKCPWTTPAKGGPWTKHGHAIAGITVDGPGRPLVARCGGPLICKDCALDEVRIRFDQGRVVT